MHAERSVRFPYRLEPHTVGGGGIRQTVGFFNNEKMENFGWRLMAAVPV